MKTKTDAAVILGLDWLGDFRASLEDGRDVKTVAAYMQDLGVFGRWFERANGEPFGPALLNTRDLKDFRTWSLEVEGVKPATWNRRAATLRLLAAWCEAQNGRGGIQFGRALKPAVQQELAPRWLEGFEERKLMRQVEININAARTDLQRVRALRDQAMVAVMRYAGLRVEETAELALEDVSISDRKGSVVVRQGKRDKRRTVPLSSSCRDALRDWLAVRGDAPGSLFGVAVRGIQKRMELLGVQTGLDDLDCHCLRHTCAKQMVDAGRPLTEVQAILGHEKLETTACYIMPGREDLAEAVEAGQLGRLGRD